MTPEPTLTFTHEGKPYGIWVYDSTYGDGRIVRTYDVAPLEMGPEGYEGVDLRHWATVRGSSPTSSRRDAAACRARAAEALAEAALYEAAADAVDAAEAKP